MKNADFLLEDDENMDEKIEKRMNNINNKSTSKIPKGDKSDNILKKKKKIVKKESSGEQANKNENIPLEEQEFIEFILMDFRQFDELNKFTKMKSLVLVQQNIKSIEDICCCSYITQLEFLCLNENLIESFKAIEKFSSLRELQINFNSIQKIDYIKNLQLEKLWVCENKITKIENLPHSLKSLWIATNLIDHLDQDLLIYENINDLNLSANLLCSFQDIYILSKLKSLENLNLNDPNFGENPICLINNYRLNILHRIPNLKILDEVIITKEEKDEFEIVYLKKTSFYKNKIKHLNRISKITFKFLKIFGVFFKLMKLLQIYFFRKRINMLQYIQYERICLDTLEKIKSINLNEENSGMNKSSNLQDINKETINNKYDVNDNLGSNAFNNLMRFLEKININENNLIRDNIFNDDLILEMNKEIELTNEKIKKCVSNCQMIDINYNVIKNYISETNDFSIISNFYELESGGNMKLESGYLNDKWALSCIELMKNRISSDFLSKHSIKNINVMKVWKITNKPRRLVFDNLYDYLIDLNNKFGEDKKYYDFFFMFLQERSLEKITKNIFDNFQFKIENENENNSDSEKILPDNQDILNLLKNNNLFIFSSHLDKFDDYRLNVNKGKDKGNTNHNYINDLNYNCKQNQRFYTVICKCIKFENLIKHASNYYNEDDPSLSDLNSIVEEYLSKGDLDQSILEINNNSKEKSIFLTKNNSIFIPEYLLEYNYIFNNININIHSISKSENKFLKNKQQITTILNSSYFSKDVNLSYFQEEYIQVFNNSLKKILNSELRKFIPEDIIDNYSSCKFQYFEELNNTELFFAKNTIYNYLHIAHKYPNSDTFSEEFNKIIEKLEEIKSLNFRNPLVTLSSKAKNYINDSNNLKTSNDNLLNKKSRSLRRSKNNDEENIPSSVTEGETILTEITFNKIDKAYITYLNLFQSNINDSSFIYILDNLSECKSLKILCLAFNHLKNVSLLDLMKNMENLRNLDLSNNLIYTINFNQLLLNRYKSFQSKLEILDLNFNCISNFTEILELIYLSYKCKFQKKENICNNNLLKNLINISFLGNPIANKIHQYLLNNEKMSLFNFELKPQIKGDQNNKSGSNIIMNEGEFDIEKFFRDIVQLMKQLEFFNFNKKDEDNYQAYKTQQTSETIYKENISNNKEEENIKSSKDNFFSDLKKIDISINNKKESQDRELICKNENNLDFNFIDIYSLKQSYYVDKIVNYSLIEDLKQFNIVYNTFSFKKSVPDDKIKIKYELNEKEFDDVFQDNLNKNKSSNVFLLSKQKLNTIPLFSRSGKDPNKFDLIFMLHPYFIKEKTKNSSSINLSNSLVKEGSISINLNDSDYIENKFKVKYDDATKLIKIVYLNINKLTNFRYLDQFSDVEELYLQNNKFKNFPNFIFLNLKKLDISNNNIYSLNGISNLPNLIYLNMENNFINNLNLNEMVQLEELLELNIGGNYIHNLKECILLKNMKKLFNLDISGNEVCNNPEMRISLINYLPKLKILNRIQIDKNELLAAKEYFEGRITSELLESKIGNENPINIKELDLSNNKLKDFENIFNCNNFPNLKILNLSRNIFSSFKIFGSLPNLQELYLNSNVFEKIFYKKDKTLPSQGILGIMNVELLELCDNNLNDLNGVQALKNLKTLVLRENKINKIDCLDGLINLQYLDISFNKLRTIERSNIGLLPNLKTILCDSNYLKNINSFSKLQSLIYLSFDTNKITDISNIEKLTELENLKEINLSNNPITKNINYRLNIIRKFFNLTKIDSIEITKDEREIAIMDQSCQPTSQGLETITPNNMYMAKMENTKMAMKVNFVNLDLMIGNGALNVINTKIINDDNNFINYRERSPKRPSSFEPGYVLSLPHINSTNQNLNNNNFLNQNKQNFFKKKNQRQASTTNINQINIISNKQIKTKTKGTNLPLGNLFKQIGEVISGGHQNENLANLINKLNNRNPQFSQYELKPIRPKSNTFRK